MGGQVSHYLEWEFTGKGGEKARMIHVGMNCCWRIQYKLIHSVT